LCRFLLLSAGIIMQHAAILIELETKRLRLK
jgi:hypothetical protein